jgi:tRNA modification GTPase
VLDIIRAKTDSALKIGMGQLKGLLSREVRKVRKLLLDILSVLEANIDFPEEEIDTLQSQRIGQNLATANERLKSLLVSARTGRIFREGIHVVICGKPNVGKSSLLNALLKYERSIVTAVAGTTRDTIEEIIDIKGIPVRIVDTAGVLTPRDPVEKKAVQRSKEHIDQADLALILFDGSRRITKEDRVLISRLKKKNAIAIINKIDLKQRIEQEKIRKSFKLTVELSAKQPKNIHLLEDAISDLIFNGRVTQHEPLMIANLRHASALREAQILIAQALNSLDNKLSSEFIAQDVKESLLKLDELLGERFSEDLLDKIFSEFCIGK